MNITATVLLAFGMSMDAFAASVVKVSPSIIKNFQTLRTSLILVPSRASAADRLGMGILASCP